MPRQTNEIVRSTLTQETEPNNSFRQANPIQIDTVIAGDLGGRADRGILDGRDFFVFEVTQPTKLEAQMVASTSGVNQNNITTLRLYRDFNEDGIDNSGIENGISVQDFLDGTPTVGADVINFDRLDPGKYLLEASRNTTPRFVEYRTSVIGRPIESAELTLKIDRLFTFRNPSTPTLISVKAEIDGTVIERENLNNQREGRNIELKANVDVNKRFIPIRLTATQTDPLTGETKIFDLNRFNGKTDLELTYDTLDRRITGRGFIPGGENALLRNTVNDANNNGEGVGSSLLFFVDYATTASTAASVLPDDVPVIEGNNRKQTMSGNNRSGILKALGGRDTVDGKGGDDIADGGNGNDTIFGKAGHDILVGSAGKDTLMGNAGDDILFGGKGKDTLEGSQGRDVFVLAPQSGPDTIVNFQDGVDVIGLAEGLTFESLRITQQQEDVLIQVGRDRLGIVQNAAARQFTAKDFVQIDFTTIAGVETPFVVV